VTSHLASRLRGVSAVEILVGLAVGLVLLAGISSMVLGSRQTSRSEQSLVAMQATGRIAMDMLGRELRKAGYRTDRERSVDEAFPSAAAPFVAAGAVIVGQAGDAGLAVRFQAAGDSWSSDCLGNPLGAGEEIHQTLWLQGSELFCRTQNLTAGTDQSLPLVPQIEALRLRYGIDTDGDGFADEYRAAAAVTDWARLASVKLQMRMVSAEDGLTDAPQAFLDLDGTAQTPTDRRLRRSFATVIALRNILP
jgi:type IV pilus assembly protein PilW